MRQYSMIRAWSGCAAMSRDGWPRAASTHAWLMVREAGSRLARACESGAFLVLEGAECDASCDGVAQA